MFVHRQLLIATLCVALAGGSAIASVRPETADEAQLREIKEVLWPKAYREQDAALLDRILADEFQLIDDEGTRSSKAEELDYVRKNKPSYDTFRFVITRLQVFENRTAIVSGTGQIETTGTAGKKGSQTEYHSSNVFIHRDGRWQAIASHTSGGKKKEL